MCTCEFQSNSVIIKYCFFFLSFLQRLSGDAEGSVKDDVSFFGFYTDTCDKYESLFLASRINLLHKSSYSFRTLIEVYIKQAKTNLL